MKSQKTTATAEKLIDIAESFFAEKGFYGTSIRDLADGIAIAKSSLLHHYPSKEKLYGAVLKKLAGEMTLEVKYIRKQFTDEKEQIFQFVQLLCNNSEKKPNRENIILRELIDNPKRAEKAKKWFFVDYFKELTGIIKSGQTKGLFKPINPEIFILQLLGAHRYLIISLPTVKQFFDEKIYQQILKDHRTELETFVNERLINEEGV
ncbi:MAG: TetR/AcrR family transcriptional regulator [Desulfobacteraceae bacterium]|nr:TetR/AcrR family transcriptional regulator [Desulfobacteraceae bacterium]MBC2757528.1 TetR/AcrR family transcriptional regulator [Desulfobacteraceae bacterium]